jgi:hypothetical protein
MKILLTILMLMAVNANAAVLCESLNGGLPYNAGSLANASVSLSCRNTSVVVTSAQVVTTAIAWPSDRRLTFAEGGSVSFTGVGALTGLYESRPEWFGAISADGVDDGAAFNAAVNSLNAGGELIAKGGTYLLNTQVYAVRDDITINLGSSIILNTTTIPAQAWEGQQINPIIKVSANRVTIKGGFFKDCVSQGIFAGGTLNAGAPIYGNVKSGFTVIGTRFSNLDDVAGVSESKCVQTRHVDNVLITGVVCENIGHARADRYSNTLSINYANGGSITDCTVMSDFEGGAANMLYVGNGTISGNRFTGITNVGNGLLCTAVHVKFSESVTISGNTIKTTGMVMKISEDVKNIIMTGNYLVTTGVYPTTVYAAVFLQGSYNFTFSGNVLLSTAGRAIYAAPHTATDNTGQGIITGNYIRGNYNADTELDETPVTYGSGIQFNAGNTDANRRTIMVSGNHFHNCDVWLFQSLGSTVKNNFFVQNIDLYNNTTVPVLTGALDVSGSSSIYLQSGTNNVVSGNTISILAPNGSANRIGIRLSTASYSLISNNIVSFASGATLAYDYVAQTSTTGMTWDKNTSVNATIVNPIAGNAFFGATGTPSATVPGAAFIYDGSAGVELRISTPTTSGDTQVVFYNPNGSVGSITTNGSATAYNTSSDYRLKDNVEDLTNSGSFIDALKPRTWKWKVDNTTGVGFVAHELQAVSPQSVTGYKDQISVNEDGETVPVIQAVAYGSPELVANLVAEIKDLRRRLLNAGI